MGKKKMMRSCLRSFLLTQTLALSLIVLALTLVIVLTLTLLLPLTYGGDWKPVKPTQKDKCPVCGMFVAKYPDFLAEVIFKDGSYTLFDGAKDMFKYLLNLRKYNTGKSVGEIDSIYVTEYYHLTLIDGHEAYYVIGSDIYGPMGRELVPVEKEPEAMEFMKDHKGKSILKFKEITLETLRGLE
jgi:copper chaperone NosL